MAIAIALWVLPRTWILLRDTTHIFLQGVPSGIDLDAGEGAISDTPGAAELQRVNMRIVMLTGDNRRTVEAVAGRVGIDEIMTEVLPDQKQAKVQQLQAEGRRVTLPRDGIDDAPKLAAAEIGIAVGTGTDVAMESAAAMSLSSVLVIGNSLRLRSVKSS